MGVIFEDDNGTVQTMRKRAVAQMAMSGQDVGTKPVPESTPSVSDIMYAMDMFKSDETLTIHAKDFARNMITGYRFNESQKASLMSYVEGLVKSMPSSLKKYERLSDLNKVLQKNINAYIVKLQGSNTWVLLSPPLFAFGIKTEITEQLSDYLYLITKRMLVVQILYGGNSNEEW